MKSKTFPFTLNLFFLFLSGTLLISCGGNSVYEDKKDFKDKYWAFDDPAIFEFEITNIQIPYDLSFSIRNTSKYRFQNIYLQYYLEDSTGKLLSSELKNVLLFHAKTGTPLGKGLGDVNDIERKFIENYTFGYAGKYKMRIDQFMRQDSLANILSVGLRIDKATE